MKDTLLLRAGLKFQSKTFRAEAEIVSLDESTDTIRVRLTPSDGNAYESEWPLLATKDHFKQGFYFIPEHKPNDVTVW